MRLRLLLFLLFCGFVSPVLFPVQAATSYWKFPGVVFRVNDYNNIDFASGCPNCGPTGGIFHIKWNEFHRGMGNYDFSKIDNYLNAAKQMQTTAFPDGRKISKPVLVVMTFYMGAASSSYSPDFTPEWVYGSGATKMWATCYGAQTTIPAYNSQTWRNAFYDAVQGLGNYYRSKASEFPNLAGFVISTGYNDEAYAIDPSNGANCTWPETSTEAFNRLNIDYQNYFIPKLAETAGAAFTSLPVYLPAGGVAYSERVITEAAKYGIGAKTNTLSPGAEACCFSWICKKDSVHPDFTSIIGDINCANNSLPHTAIMLSNETTSWAMEDARGIGITYDDYIWDRYYQWLIPISLHADWVDYRNEGEIYTIGSHYPYLSNTFTPLYLGKTKTNTPGAWIGFRDLRDWRIVTTGVARPNEISCGGRGQGTAAEMVCHTHKIGDLEYYLKRVGNDQSVVVLWDDLPSAAQSQVYGFGRQINTGQSMYLKLENGTWFANSVRNLWARLVYLNNGGGAIKITVKKSDGSTYDEVFQKGSAVGSQDQFVEVNRQISGVSLTGGLSNGADIMITSDGGTSLIHMLEIRPMEDAGPTPTPTHVFNLVAGWNNIAWQSGWPSRSFANVPQQCPYVSYRQNDWFSDWARNYNVAETFSSGEYQIYCNQNVSWTI